MLHVFRFIVMFVLIHFLVNNYCEDKQIAMAIFGTLISVYTSISMYSLANRAFRDGQKLQSGGVYSIPPGVATVRMETMGGGGIK